MAKKIRSWEEYDVSVKERQEQTRPEVETRLEQLLRADAYIKKKKKVGEFLKTKYDGYFFGVLEGGIHPGIQALPIYQAIDGAFTAHTNRRREELRPQALVDVTRQHFRHNIGYLVHCATTRARSGIYLQDQDKEEFYKRLVEQLGTLAKKDEEFKAAAPQLQDLTLRLDYPDENEQTERLRQILSTLRKKKYLPLRDADQVIMLLTMREQAAANGTAAVLTAGTTGAAPREATSSPTPALQVEDYLSSQFKLSPDKVRKYSSLVTAREVEELWRKLGNVVGEEHTIQLVQENPNLLLYVSEGILPQYLKVLGAVKERLITAEAEVAERFGMEKNRKRYAGLELILELKRELLMELGEEATPAPSPSVSFDLERYTNKLLQKAEVDIDWVKALTDGKNLTFVGNSPAKRDRFRKFAATKIERRKLGLFDAVFDTLIRYGVVKTLPPSRDACVLNSNLDEITNPYLREYMRVTLYKDQILAQEGQITPLIDLDAEEKPKP